MKTVCVRTASVDEYGGVTKFRNITVTADDGVGVHVTGMSDRSVKESLLRVFTALQSSGYSVPAMKIQIEVSPHDMGAASRTAVFDLPIAIGILKASGQVRVATGGKAVFGELGLDGSIRYREHTADCYRHGGDIREYIEGLGSGKRAGISNTERTEIPDSSLRGILEDLRN